MKSCLVATKKGLIAVLCAHVAVNLYYTITNYFGVNNVDLIKNQSSFFLEAVLIYIPLFFIYYKLFPIIMNKVSRKKRDN